MCGHALPNDVLGTGSCITVSSFDARFAEETASMVERAVRAGAHPAETPADLIETLSGLTAERLVSSVRKGKLILAFGGGHVVGTGSLCAGCIHSVYVEPRLWRRGIGRRLVTALERIARHGSAERAFLFATARTEGFYRSLGYGISDRLDEELEPVYRMFKTLRETAATEATV